MKLSFNIKHLLIIFVQGTILDTWEKRINGGGKGPVLMELLKEKSIKQETTIMLFLTFTHNNKNPPQNPERSLSKPLI